MKWKVLQMPQTYVIDEAASSDAFGRFIIEPLERGFGYTLGNTLRRVLLSSLQGAAIVACKFNNSSVLHEFSPVPGVLEDATDIVLNLKQRCAVCGKRESNLTPKQAALLEIFMRHPGEVLTRGFLMKQVWNTDYVGDTRTLEVHIHWLRKAIEEDAGSPSLLRTVRRVGYRFSVPEKKKKRKK